MKTTKSILLSSVLFVMIGCGGGSTQPNTEDTSTTPNAEQLQTQSNSQNLDYDENGKITSIDANGSVTSIAVSTDALFLAEGENGVEIISIGYSDTISTEVLYEIKDINAQNVTLSADEKTLYIEDKEGFIQIVDISDLSHPVRKGHTTKQEVNHAATSKNGTYLYIPRNEDGLEIVNVSNPSNHYIESTFTKSNAFDVILVENDTKALIAAGSVGINLLDVRNPALALNTATYRIDKTKITGLSLDKSQELLFVATGNKGVLIFNLDILLDKLNK